MTTTSKLLAKLEARQDKLRAEIKAAKKAEQKRLDAAHAEKCRALGAAVLAESETDPELIETLRPILNKHTKTKKARLLLGLDEG